MNIFITLADVPLSFDATQKAFASAASFVGEKLVDFAKILEPYKNQMAERAVSASAFIGEKITYLSTAIEPYVSSIAHEVTSFASAHPVLTSTVGTIVVLALALKIALIAFKCFDKCCKSNKKKPESQFTNEAVIIPNQFQSKYPHKYKKD